MFVRSKLVPELIVTDIKNSLHFWTSLIGFKIAYERPEAGFAYLDKNGVQIMLEQYDPGDGQWMTGALEAPFGRGINFQIDVDLVDPILERLSEVEWPLFRPCADAWYRADAVEVGQREFLVQDPDGYLVRFMESLGERPRADLAAAEETTYLLRSPANAERLIKSIGNLRSGKINAKKLIEE